MNDFPFKQSPKTWPHNWLGIWTFAQHKHTCQLVFSIRKSGLDHIYRPIENTICQHYNAPHQ